MRTNPSCLNSSFCSLRLSCASLQITETDLVSQPAVLDLITIAMITANVTKPNIPMRYHFPQLLCRKVLFVLVIPVAHHSWKIPFSCRRNEDASQKPTIL